MKDIAPEKALFEIRKAAYDFLCEIKSYHLQGRIIEVGKMQKQGKIYEEFPQYFIDTKDFFKECQFIQMDIDPLTQPDLCSDLVDIDQHFQTASVDGIILLHILEHVTKLWEVPAKLAKILKPGALVFIQTPWNFRFHGPRPDCWRISDDGYEALFKEHFEVVSLQKINPFNDYLHPLVLNVILRKL